MSEHTSAKPWSSWKWQLAVWPAAFSQPLCSTSHEDIRNPQLWEYEDIRAMQEELVMERGYESVGSPENLVWALGREWEKSIGRKVNLSKGKINQQRSINNDQPTKIDHKHKINNSWGKSIDCRHTGCFIWLVLPQKVLSMELVPPNRKKWQSTLVLPNFPSMAKFYSAVFKIIYSFLITICKTLADG